MLAWIDDFYLVNFRSTKALSPKGQFQAAQAAAFLTLEVFYHAGYFVSIPKCQLHPSTRIVFLGIICDSQQGRFEVPEEKLTKLEAILSSAIASGTITFKMLEKLAGKCTSLSVAVPVAALYTHHMYKQIALFQRTGGKKIGTEIDIPANSGLMFELRQWLLVRARFNGASWYRAEHKMLSLTGASDASSSGWGGLVRSPGCPVYKAGGDFPPNIAKEHINIQEGYALQQTLGLFCGDHPQQVAGSTVLLDVDNKVLHDSLRRGRARNTLMHDVITQLFWMQVDCDFTLKLRWVDSESNAEADRLSRQSSDEFIRLDESVFGELSKWAGTFDMDLMATPASAHYRWDAGRCTGVPLPFYSRFHTQGCAGVDVLTQDVSRMPDSQMPCFGFCFPPTSMVGVVLQHLEECRARAVVIVPDRKLSWFPRLASAMVRCKEISAPFGISSFFRIDHRAGRQPFSFKWGMLAVEVNFA